MIAQARAKLMPGTDDFFGGQRAPFAKSTVNRAKRAQVVKWY
jgi:hypothetical protein